MATLVAGSQHAVLSQQQDFDDAVHELINFSRPLASNQKTELDQLLSTLILQCGTDQSRWQTFMLALTHKRYHRLSPTGRGEAKAKGKKSVEAGEGERLVFYSSFRFLFERAVKKKQEGTSDEMNCLSAAVETLTKIAPHAGGSRDICQLLVDMVQVVLAEWGSLENARHVQVSLTGKVCLSCLVCQGVVDIENACKEQSGIMPLSCLAELLRVAATTLDQDFDIIKRHTEENASSDQEREFPSTLPVFLPHRDRGRSKKRKEQERGPEYFSERQLLQSITEILIWSRTQKAATVKTFADVHRRVLETTTISRDTAKRQLTVLQTIIRGLRKKLNSYARDKGFMLSDQYTMKTPALSSSQLKWGKAGDLSVLARLAKKNTDHRVMKLIQLRGATGKATTFSSVREALNIPTVAKGGDAEIVAIERDIYLARLKATLNHLHGLIKTHDKPLVVASMDNCDTSHALAVLVAAAMFDWAASETSEADPQPAWLGNAARLFIAGNKKEIACLQDTIDLLNAIANGLDKNELDVPSFMDVSGAASTKAVINMIDRHVKDSEVFLLVTGADIHLPRSFMKALSDRGCSMHCHDADNIRDRLQRESARSGDVTISLSWNTKDDLDLHVFVPGGEEISYQNRFSKDKLCGLDVDMNAGKRSNEPVENVFLGDMDRKMQAPLGRYKVVVQNYAYHASPVGTPVPFVIVVDSNGTKKKHVGQCEGYGESSNVVVCEFDYTGRTIPFPGDDKETAFTASDMVNMTASTGQTLESIGQLVQVVQQHEHIDIVRPLLTEHDEGEVDEMDEEETAAAEPFVLTSQDRINILLAKLPARFHAIVGDGFGGSSLAETCAESIARRMVADRIKITELKRNGFPVEIVDAVKAKMALVDVM